MGHSFVSIDNKSGHKAQNCEKSRYQHTQLRLGRYIGHEKPQERSYNLGLVLDRVVLWLTWTENKKYAVQFPAHSLRTPYSIIC